MAKINSNTANKLKRFNLIAGVFHLIQMVAVIALSNSFSIPVTASYLQGPPGTALGDPVVLFNTPVGVAVALFLGLSAIAHFIVASGAGFPKYMKGLEKNQNIFRWVEYSISSSVMIILIAQVSGISDFVALLAIFGVNVSMILFGWVQEKYTQPKDGDFLPFIFGCITGIFPWIALVILVIGPKAPMEVQIPGFVYGIIVSLFLFFNSFALVQYLQYRAKGKWKNYLRGERTYIVLSLVAKSALAWQIFSGTLIPQ